MGNVKKKSSLTEPNNDDPHKLKVLEKKQNAEVKKVVESVSLQQFESDLIEQSALKQVDKNCEGTSDSKNKATEMELQNPGCSKPDESTSSTSNKTVRHVPSKETENVKNQKLEGDSGRADEKQQKSVLEIPYGELSDNKKLEKPSEAETQPPGTSAPSETEKISSDKKKKKKKRKSKKKVIRFKKN